MYERFCTFFNNNIIYNLQLGFRQHYSTSHALINLTESIRKAFDEENIGCGVFANLEKAFDTLDNQLLLAKLNHYMICGISNDWFKSYLSNHIQILYKTGYDSVLAAINCGVPQGSVLGPILFLPYLNYLHHFADDTNLLLILLKMRTN